ncbi:PAS domain-containing protein [Roseateles asaccharophilus]|uniref:PAS domain S-box-containing protein n=1 Tax=Roseateles asaccharophilus TaxID=582607 RepID=A0ABU2AGE3_9BURK|nr:PAS domain-containing protein [Roseateles asaccharophilus]MDR7335013.1 PAS domain S-box-containing protein [Roseateles asaccharophilus]
MFGQPPSPALLDLVGDPVLTLRSDLSALRANPAARAWLGTDAAEGWRLLRQAAGSRLETWLRDAAHAIDTGRAPPPAPPLKLADGQRATLHLLRDRPNWLLHARLSAADPGEPPLGEWMALSPLPMLLADAASGAVLRHNAAFSQLCAGTPRQLNDLPDLLQALLGWSRGMPVPALSSLRAPDGPLVTEAEFVDPQGRHCWLQARLRLWRQDGRTLLQAVLEDQSLLHERDLAHQQLDALMDTAAVGLATFQPEGGWLKAHRKSAPFKGAGKGGVGSLQGISRDIVEPASLPEFERLQRALKKGDPVEVRYAVRHPELGRRWLLTRVAPGLLAGGRRTTSVVTLDVTAQAQAENALLLRAESERAVLDSVLVGIVTVGPDGIEWMNRSARRMFGCELEDVLGQPMGVLAPEDNEHAFHAEPGSDVFECRLRGRDGREFWVIGNAVQTPRDDGAEGGTQLTYALLDIDRRRQAEAQSRLAQASLARIIEGAPMAITLHEAHSLRIVKLNQAAAAMGGRSEAQLLGSGPEALFGAQQGERVAADMREALASLAVVQREYQVPAGSGTRVWDTRLLHLAGVSGDDAPELLLLVASDVTEQRAAEQARLQAAISQRELLVREVHHRIKNNLQGVAGLLQQIAARRPEVAPVLKEAVGQVQAIAQVYGLQVGASGPLVLKRVFDAIVGSVQRAQGRVITTTAEGGALLDDWCLPEAEAIPIALSLNELLGNALRHGDGAAARCQLICDPAGVTVEIVNTGHLPDGFELQNVRSGVSGLGLVRALLPRRSAILSLEQQGTDVLCRLELIPPSVVHNPATKPSS